MRYIRYRDATGSVWIALEQPSDVASRLEFMQSNENDLVGGLRRGFTAAHRAVSSDPEVLELFGDYTLLTPLDAPEVWCASMTYPASRRARLEETRDPEPYRLLAEDRRQTFHLKDAGGHRTVASGQPLAVRSDATWMVPEPEIGLVIGEHGRILGYTIVNDLCARDIRGASPFLLSRATTYRSSCAIGPAVYVEEGRQKPFTVYLRVSDSDGNELVAQKASTKDMLTSFRALVDDLSRDNPLPPGTVVATGAAVVPPESFALQPGHVVEIHVPEIGTLTNPIVLVADLEESDIAARRRALTLDRLER